MEQGIAEGKDKWASVIQERVSYECQGEAKGCGDERGWLTLFSVMTENLALRRTLQPT